MFSKLYHRLQTWVGKNKPLAMMALRAMALARGMRVRVEEKGDDERIRISSGDRVILLASRHYPYVRDILDDFDYYFEAVECQIKDGLRMVDYSRPAEHVLKPSGLKFFFTSLPESDCTTGLYLDKAKLRPGDVVLDLGAYCGATAYFFSRLVGEEGRVISFEPDPHNFLALQRNIATHGLRNVLPINKGLWSAAASLVFQAEGNLGSSVATVTKRRTALQTVSVISLDDAIEEAGLTRLDFVKMDIEGAEATVLEHARKFWQHFRPDFMIEPHLVGGELSTQSVCEILKRHGYECQIIPQARLRLPLIYATARGG